VYLHVPEQDLIDVDMGTPELFRRILMEFNRSRRDPLGNIIFPGASIHPASSECIALPGSRSNTPLHQAIIPEGLVARTPDDYLTV